MNFAVNGRTRLQQPPAPVLLYDFRAPWLLRYFMLVVGAAVTWFAVALTIWTTLGFWLLPGTPAAPSNPWWIALVAAIGVAWLQGALGRIRVLVDRAHTTILREHSLWGFRRTVSFPLHDASAATVSVTRGARGSMSFDVYLRLASGSTRHLTSTRTANEAHALANRLNSLMERSRSAG